MTEKYEDPVRSKASIFKIKWHKRVRVSSAFYDNGNRRKNYIKS